MNSQMFMYLPVLSPETFYVEKRAVGLTNTALLSYSILPYTDCNISQFPFADPTILSPIDAEAN